MFATADDVLDLTGFTADRKDIKLAQAIVEAYAGRVEPQVTNEGDLVWLKYATAWQVAYMANDRTSIFEQANVQSIRQNKVFIQIGGNDYYISPLAAKAVSRLSWMNTRSISTLSSIDGVSALLWEYN